MRGLSLVVASGGHSSLQCVGLSLSWPLLLQSTGSRRAGSVVAAHGPSCSAACGIFPDQGSNPCPLHWQADSQPLHHQGSPRLPFCSAPPSAFLLGRWDATWFMNCSIKPGRALKFTWLNFCYLMIQIRSFKLDTILSQHLCKLNEIDHFSREYVSQKVTQDEVENLNRSITINRNLNGCQNIPSKGTKFLMVL